MRADALFEQMVREHQGPVIRICRSILQDDHLGADAAQEAFLRLWRRLGRGSLQNAAGWLRRAAVSAALDLVRRRARVRERAVEALEEDAGSLSGGPASQVALKELRRHLQAAVDRLPEAQRTVFLLRHQGGVPLREVAELLGLALPTAKTHFARACLKLQKALAPHFQGKDLS